MPQANTIPATVGEIIGTRDFQLGVSDYMAGVPFRHEYSIEYFAVTGDYERGRLAAAAWRAEYPNKPFPPSRVGRRLNSFCVLVVEGYLLEGDLI